MTKKWIDFKEYIFLDGVEFEVEGKYEVLREPDIDAISITDVDVVRVSIGEFDINPKRWRLDNKSLENIIIAYIGG